MTKNNLGCCGLNCKECPVFIGTVNNDDKLRQKTAEEWSKLYAEYLGKDLNPEDMNLVKVQKNQFKHPIRFEERLNMAFYKIFSDYFNRIFQDKKLAREHGIKNIEFYREKFFFTHIDLTGTYGENNVFLTYKNLRLSFAFDVYKQSNEIHYTLILSSLNETEYEVRLYSTHF